MCFGKGIKTTPALQANFITMAEPVMAPLWTYIFLKEHLSVLSVVGCVMVIATLLIYNVSMIKSGQNSSTPETGSAV